MKHTTATRQNVVLTLEQTLNSRTLLDEVKQIVDSGTLVPEGNDETGYLTRAALSLVARKADGTFALTELERIVEARWIAFCVAKSFVGARPFLPSKWQDWRFIPYEVGNVDFDEVRKAGYEAIEDCLCMPDSTTATAQNAISIARRAMEQALPRDSWRAKDNKSLPTVEIVDVDYRKGTVDLLGIYDTECEKPLHKQSGRGRRKGTYKATATETFTPFGGEFVETQQGAPQAVTPFGGEFEAAVGALFDVVKQNHPNIRPSRLAQFEYYVLKTPNKVIAALFAISEQKASANNREFCRWLLDAVKQIPQKHVSVLVKHGLDLQAIDLQ